MSVYVTCYESDENAQSKEEFMKSLGLMPVNRKEVIVRRSPRVNPALLYKAGTYFLTPKRKQAAKENITPKVRSLRKRVPKKSEKTDETETDTLETDVEQKMNSD